MTTEKLKRVQSVRKWLEKAEQSFSRHRDISGELNLMMARAEMQRLDETNAAKLKNKIWGNRILAMVAAAALIIGFSEWKSSVEREDVSIAPAVKLTETLQNNNAEEPVLNQSGLLKNNREPVYSEENRNSSFDKKLEQEKQSPILSEFEIQRVVGQAGRALRGQS